MRNKGIDAFEERLKRISRAESRGMQYLVGEGDVRSTTISAAEVRYRGKAKESASLDLGSLILGTPKWAIAFVLGCAAMLAGRLLGYHVIGQFINSGDMMQLMLRHAGEIGAGFALLVTAATFWGPRGAMAKMAMSAGFVLMLLGEPNVAKQAPMAWEAMFSPQYAAAALQPTAGVMSNVQSIVAALQSLPI